MKVRLIGAHNLETRLSRHTCFLIDEVLALDAGSLASSLSLADYGKIRALLLTHEHFDHCRDVPTLGLATLEHPGTIQVYALAETLASVKAHFLDDNVYPDLTKGLRDAAAKYQFHAVNPSGSFQVLGYRVQAIPALHPVPAVGYIVRSADGAAVAYTGDTGGNVLPFLKGSQPPGVLFVDVTFPNRLEQRAKTIGHLTPALLAQELGQALGMGLRLPRIIPVHLGLQYKAELIEELAAQAQQMGIELKPGYEDMVLD